MPIIFKHKINSSISLAVWHISETEEFLFENSSLSPFELLSIKNYKLPKRRKEKLACRLALSYLLDNKTLNVIYDSFGKPFLEGYQISFSHSGEFVAVIVSQNTHVGIDIEKLNTKILKLYSRFLNQQELNNHDCKDLKTLHLCWGTKESIFKIIGKPILDFQNEILVNPIPSIQPYGTFSAKTTNPIIHFNTSLFYWINEGYCLVAAIKEE